MQHLTKRSLVFLLKGKYQFSVFSPTPQNLLIHKSCTWVETAEHFSSLSCVKLLFTKEELQPLSSYLVKFVTTQFLKKNSTRRQLLKKQINSPGKKNFRTAFIVSLFEQIKQKSLFEFHPWFPISSLLNPKYFYGLISTLLWLLGL